MTAKDARDKAAKLARKVLKLPEDPVPVISTADWIRSFFDVNLVTAVRPFPHLPHHPILTPSPRRFPTLEACSPSWDGYRDTVLPFSSPTFPTADAQPLDFTWLTGDLIAGITGMRRVLLTSI